MADSDPEIGDTTLVDAPRRGFRNWWLAVAALVFLALWGWRELDIRRMREIEASDRAEQLQLTEENLQLKQRLDRLLAAVASPQMRTITLTGRQNTAGASGKVFVEPNGGRAIVIVSDLSPNGTTKDYQLWITRTNAPGPQSVLVFDVPQSREATLSVENVPPPAQILSIGVTLGPVGGAQTPPGEFLLAGKP